MSTTTGRQVPPYSESFSRLPRAAEEAFQALQKQKCPRDKCTPLTTTLCEHLFPSCAPLPTAAAPRADVKAEMQQWSKQEQARLDKDTTGQERIKKVLDEARR